MNDWKESFIKYFEEGAKQSETLMLGVEAEHFIIDRETREAVPYLGEKGIRQILLRLIKLYPNAEILSDDDFFGFRVPDFSVTLEPAAQMEISIAPKKSIRQIGEIYHGFYQNLNTILSKLGYEAINAGCQPVSRVADLKMIPKRRYDLMNAYFGNLGTGGMEMMRGSASLQVSVDYRSETDFRRKIQAAYYYAPIFKLLCDNSAGFQGEFLKKNLKRTDIWRRVDPVRCGILPKVFSDTYGFADYADFLGAVPPIFLKYKDQTIPTGDRTIAELFDNKELTNDEIEHLISMAFPDVRLKQFIELRFADSVPFHFILAYCALIKGLIYSEEGLEYAKKQISDNNISEECIIQAEDELMDRGWEACIYGHPVKKIAKNILDLARRNLLEEEHRYLSAFDAVIEYGGICKIPKKVICCARRLSNEITG